MSEAAAIDIYSDRRNYIGGGDAPCIAGVDKYKQPVQLYHEKRGEWLEDDLSGNDAVHFGVFLEDKVAEEWARRSGERVRNQSRAYIHPELPYIAGHIDRKVEGKPEGLECKNRSWFMAREYGAQGTDEVMDSDLVQCQHYMAVTGWERWHLACYFGGADFRTYTIERDEAFIRDLVELEQDFWQCVLEGRQPALDLEHGTASDLLARMYPGTSGEVVTLPDEALRWHQVAVEAAELEKAYSATKDGARLHLRRLIGEAAVGLLPDGSGAGYTRKVIEPKAGPVSLTPTQAAAARAVIELGLESGAKPVAALRAAHEALEGFSITPRLDFRFSNSPKGVKNHD